MAKKTPAPKRMPIDQAKALMKAILKAPITQAHFEAILGVGHVATVTDFDSQDAEKLDRAEKTLRHVDACIGSLWTAMVGRPRQGEMDFDGDKKRAAEAQAKKDEEKKKPKTEREKVLKGVLNGGDKVDEDAAAAKVAAAKSQGAARTGKK